MALPLRPPVRPMLARLSRELPSGEQRFEPKWDGFRCLVFRDGDDVDLRSRNDRPLARYFPELVDAVRLLDDESVVLDGEVLVAAGGRADFEALMARLHPAASRAALLARDTPASFVAFDVLARDDEVLLDAPFDRRRAVLERVLAAAPACLRITPITSDRSKAAQWLARAGGGGVDGVVAKPASSPYQPGKRAMVKVKTERTAECVAAGARLFADPVAVASLLLGLYDDGVLHHVGVTSSFPEEQRRRLVEQIRPLATDLEGHPWQRGFGTDSGRVGRLPGAATRWTPDLSLDWLPLRPVAVCEVAYDHVDGGRFRHPARFRRWRPDRDPASCTADQLEVDADAATLLGS